MPVGRDGLGFLCFGRPRDHITVLVRASQLDDAFMILAQEEDAIVVAVGKYQGNVSVILVHRQPRPRPKVPVAEGEHWGPVVYDGRT